MVRKTTRRGKRVLVIDFTYTKPDGTEGRYRRDAAVQTMAAATTEEASRKLGATLYGDAERMCGQNGQPLRPVPSTEEGTARVAETSKEPTLGETVRRWGAEYAPSVLRPSTRTNYGSCLRAHVLPPLGELPVSEAFDPARVREVDVSLVDGGSSTSLRRNTAFALRSVATFALEARILTQAPAFPVAPKQGKRVPTAPLPGDVALVIDAASCQEHRLVILLAAHAGLRSGEIRALRCGDCDLEHTRLVVRLSRFRSYVGPPKSGNEREVPLTPQLLAALLAAGVDRRPREECAALSTLGRPWGCNGPSSAFHNALRRVNLPRERLHALRAFFVTSLLNGNLPAHVVRELVGHGDLGTTQRYAAIIAGDRGTAVEVLERAYQGARPAVGAEKDRPARVRANRRVARVTARIRQLRRRVLGRRSAGNNAETPPIAAE